jgi:hypothetical protein
MHGYIFDVWDRLGMALAMTAWIVLLGAVVFVAVRLALGDQRQKRDL